LSNPQTHLQDALADRYRIERELGRGGTATVYLADDTRHHRKVAIKVFRPDLAQSIGPERFLREIEIAAQLQHPHIVPLLDSGSSNGFLYYVMPYVAGESLRERLARAGELPIRDAVRILSEAADALSFAHRHGVIHRDIKPGNILLAERHALVADFGVAKALSEGTIGQSALTTAGVALGTPAYMAPEQIVADPKVDHRADIYALGMVGYEILTGDPPFAVSSSQAALVAHLTTLPERPSKIRPEISPALDQAVLRCLSKHPADRWQTADELLTALEQATASGTAPVPAGKIRASGRRGLTATIGVAAGLLLLAATGAVLLRRDHDSRYGGLGRIRQLTNAPGLELDPELSPDGRLLAYAAGSVLATHIYVRQIATGRPVAVTQGMPGAHRWPRWSPDGSQLLFVTIVPDTQFVHVAPALGGPAQRVASRVKGEILGATWAPDGKRIAYAPPRSVVVQRLDGGAPDTVAKADDPNSLSWSPDGSHIAYVETNGAFILGPGFGNTVPSGIEVVSATGGTPIEVTSRESQNASPVWSRDGQSLYFLSNREGQRDLYRVRLGRSGSPAGPPEQLSSGLRAHSIALGPDGHTLLYSALTLQSNVWSIRVPPRGSVSVAEAQPVTQGNQVVEVPHVSPDGKWLAFDSDQGGNGDIYRIPLPQGEVERLTNDPEDQFSPAWSPDGAEIAFHGMRNGSRDLFVMPNGGGPTRQITSGPDQDLFPHWSPDGRRIAFARGGSPNRLYVVDRDEVGNWGRPYFLGLLDRNLSGAWSADGRHIFVAVHGIIQAISVPGRQIRKIYQARNPASDPIPVGVQLIDHDRTIVFKAENMNGSFWSLPVSGGTPRLLVRFDVPGRDSFRDEFAISSDRIYFIMANHQSDLFMAELH